MKKTLYSPLIVASLVLLASAGLLVLEYYVLDKTRTHISELQKQIQDKNTEIAKASRARSATATLDSSEEIVNSFVLKKDDIVSFLESLQATGKGLGSTVQVVSVSDEGSLTHPRVSVSLLITGTFDSVMRTIGTLENSPYDSTLTNLTLDSGDPQAKGARQWSAATVLSVGVERQATSTTKKL